MHGVSRHDLLIAVLDKDIGVFPHPRTLLLVKLCHVTRLRQGAGRFPYFCDDLLSGCMVLPNGDRAQGGAKDSHRSGGENLAALHMGPLYLDLKAAPPYTHLGPFATLRRDFILESGACP